jgi:hypothetical protein
MFPAVCFTPSASDWLISGYHGVEYEDDCLLICCGCVVWYKFTDVSEARTASSHPKRLLIIRNYTYIHFSTFLATAVGIKPGTFRIRGSCGRQPISPVGHKLLLFSHYVCHFYPAEGAASGSSSNEHHDNLPAVVFQHTMHPPHTPLTHEKIRRACFSLHGYHTRYLFLQIV